MDRAMKVKIKPAEKHLDATVETGNTTLQTFALGNTALLAGAFDDLGLEDVINKRIGKIGSHVHANNGVLVKALAVQMMNVPYQNLSGTQEYFSKYPICGLLNNQEKSADLNRAEIGRLLDDISEYGCEELFLDCTTQVAKVLGFSVKETHIDSTSFHYDGNTVEQENCLLQFKQGYSRDHRPELNQAISVMLCDAKSKIPLFLRNVSCNINDKTSFKNLIIDSLDTIKEQFHELEYLVGDSALCTEDILEQLHQKQVKVVTRLPDACNVSKQCFEKSLHEELTPIYPDKEDSPLGLWCGTTMIGKHEVKLLLVNNLSLAAKKEHTLRGRAQKEFLTLTSALKKLTTQPSKCEADAKKAFNKLISKAKLCTFGEPTYEVKLKYAKRGKPKAGEEPVSKDVTVTATLAIDEEKIQRQLKFETLYIVCTNDLQRQWTMAELLSIYKRQSVIERNWRCCKDPTMFVDSIYLKKPSRIDALLWLMMIALLVFTATEYKIRNTMQDNNLTIPSLYSKGGEARPTMERLLQYIGNLNICLAVINDKIIGISNVTAEVLALINALGAPYRYYFNANTYMDDIKQN